MPNCKPGDLAIIIKSKRARNLGRIVHVIEAVTTPTVNIGGEPYSVSSPVGEILWRIAEPIPLVKNSTGEVVHAPYCRDSVLRPIRDNDGTDETLLWAPVPKKDEVTHAL